MATEETATLQGYMLGKLDAIRESQIRLDAQIAEMMNLVRAIPVQAAVAPATITAIASTRLEKWLFSLKPLGVLVAVASRQAVNTMVIIYMARGGSLGPMEPYIKYYLGIQ